MDAGAVAQRRYRIFRRIFDLNLWGNCDSASGEGSNLERTAAVRSALPALLARHGVRSMLDAPCGDFFWMKEVALDVDSYIGADIVPELIAHNIGDHSSQHRWFIVCDLVEDELPRADLVFCRDCLVHLSYAETRRALEQMKLQQEWDPCHGLKLRYTNPVTGDFAMPTMGTFIQLLPKGFSSTRYRSTDATVFVPIEGKGRSKIGDEIFEWGPRDIFVVPSWRFVTHEVAEDAVLFSYSDRPIQQKLDLWREDRGNV